MADDHRQQLADEIARLVVRDDHVQVHMDVDQEDGQHIAALLLPLIDRVAAEAAAEALSAAAKDWRWSAWSDVPRIADQVQERITTANYVGDWIAARAAQLRAAPTVTETQERPMNAGTKTAADVIAELPTEGCEYCGRRGPLDRDGLCATGCTR